MTDFIIIWVQPNGKTTLSNESGKTILTAWNKATKRPFNKDLTAVGIVEKKYLNLIKKQ